MEERVEHPSIAQVLERSQEAGELAVRLAERFGYLPYMVERYIEMLGPEGARALLEANEEPLPVYIRCNDFLVDCDVLAERLTLKGIIVEHEPRFSPFAYRVVKARASVGATLEYLLGYYYLQGPASMSIVHALRPTPGSVSIDMAAAPGGKATQILQLMRDQGVLVAVEKSRKRIRALRANLQRMRFSSFILLRADVLTLTLGNAFDYVLLDAPSTGEGIIRKDPSRKTSRAPQDLRLVHRIQVALLDKAVRLARPGGVIVYAACTMAPEEGEMVVDHILGQHPEIDIEPHGIKASPALTSYFNVELDPRISLCGRFWPHIHGTEGFFLCRLRKRPS